MNAPVSASATVEPATVEPAAAAVEAAAELAPRLMAAAAATDREGAFPAEAMRWLHEAGLGVAPLPRQLGGQGLNDAPLRLALLCVLKHVGRGNLAVGRLYEGHVNALQLVQRFGSASQQQAAAAAAAAGLWFGVWNTQDADGLRLVEAGGAERGHEQGRERRDGERAGAGNGEAGSSRLEPARGAAAGSAQAAGWRLAGSKSFASGAGHISRPLVTAQRPDGAWQMVLVDAVQRPPLIDRSFWQPLGMRASASFRAGFEGTAVPAGWLLGEPGDYYREPAFSAGAVRFAAVQLGGAEALLDETRSFLRGLGRCDDPFQRSRLAEMAMAVESGNLWFDGAARHVDDVAYAHLMRHAVERICFQVMQAAERCVGARGLLRPQPFERLLRDLTHYLRQPAPDATLLHAGAHVLANGEPSHRLWGR